MKELEIIIRQEEAFFRLNVKCEDSKMNRVVFSRVFGQYQEGDAGITAGLVSASIVKLVSVQMILITELNENGQI